LGDRWAEHRPDGPTGRRATSASPSTSQPGRSERAVGARLAALRTMRRRPGERAARRRWPRDQREHRAAPTGDLGQPSPRPTGRDRRPRCRFGRGDPL